MTTISSKVTVGMNEGPSAHTTDLPLPLGLGYAAVFASSGDAMVLTDVTGHTVDANPAAEKLFGRSRAELLGSTPAQVVAISTAEEADILATVGSGIRWTGDVPYRLPDGTTRMSEATVHGIWSDGVLVGTVGTNRDVTEQRRTATALSETEQLWRLTLDHAPHGIALGAVDGRLLRVNAALSRLTGYSEDRLLEMSVRDITHPDDLEVDLGHLEKLVTGQIDHYAIEKRYVRADGVVFWGHLSVAAVREDGRPFRFVGQVEDVTDRRSDRTRLEQLANFDPLTGLANRSTFLSEVGRVTGRDGPRAVVGFLDLDGFKDINDTYGHAAGDRLLRIIGQRLRTTLRPGDTASRLSGDEFAVLLPALSTRSDLDQIARRLLSVLAQPYQVGGTAVSLTASLGLVVSEDAAAMPDAARLLDRADAAMYRAKAAGKNAFVVDDASADPHFGPSPG